MSPSDITTHAQAPASEPDVAGPDGGEGEIDRSQSEAKDDAALLVGFLVLWGRMHADDYDCRGRWGTSLYVAVACSARACAVVDDDHRSCIGRTRCLRISRRRLVSLWGWIMLELEPAG